VKGTRDILLFFFFFLFFSFFVQDALRGVHSKRRDLFDSCEELLRRGVGRAQREAYIMFTDLLVLFARSLRRKSQLTGLVLVPEIKLQEALQVCGATSIWDTGIISSCGLASLNCINHSAGKGY